MKRAYWCCIVLGVCLSCNSTKNIEQEAFQLVWSDEFNQAGLPDTTKWSYDVGTACGQPAGCGWGNNELQYYTAHRPENARIENGHLIIEAHQEPYQEDRKYTSARLVSKGKGDWRYGKFDFRAKLPHGKGTWAAIWMLSSEWKYGGWPQSGEIDIMEYVGFEKDSITGTIHTEAYNGMLGTQKGGGIRLPTVEDTFHTYSFEWTEDKMDWLIDGQLYYTFQNDKKGMASWPFDQTFHLILNLAVGGNWGGREGIDENIWPQRMEIDYIRVYQKTEKIAL